MGVVRLEGQKGMFSLRQGDTHCSVQIPVLFCLIVWRENTAYSTEKLKHANIWVTKMLLDNSSTLPLSRSGSLSFLFVELYAHSRRVLTFVHLLGTHHHECYQHLKDSPQPPYIPGRRSQPLPQRAHPTSTFHPWPVCQPEERAPDSSFDGRRKGVACEE